MEEVPDTVLNREACVCPSCPSFPHHCRKELLYCAVGSSSCEIHAGGCLCPDCPVSASYGLRRIYYCGREVVGEEQILMRKRKPEEDCGFYRGVYDIKAVAASGKSIVRAMGSVKKIPFSLDDLHILPAQVWRIPLNRDEPVNTDVVIGPRARKPVKTRSPVIVSGLSYGAVSRNVRIIISRVAEQEGILFNSGEGGVFDEELKSSNRIIIQYSTGRFGITEALLKSAAAVEIRFGQGAYPGKGSLLPAAKMTPEVAGLRGLKPGQDAYSPAHHADITTPDQLQKKVEWLRALTGGVPIGAKIGCGNIEKDLGILVDAGVDFIAIDGFGGGTGATNDFVRENVGIPLAAALPRAVRCLRKLGARDKTTLIAGGDLRTSADMTKCLALGANAVYIGTAAMIAINCEQYRLCHTGRCPTGVTTQDPGLMQQCDVGEGTKRLANFIRVMNEEIATLTRTTGKTNISTLSPEDLVALTREMAGISGCQWVGGEG
jgi:glutamate synthase domain-containing protein 2